MADASAIAGIHVRGWQWGYSGLLPEKFLTEIASDERERAWRAQLTPGHATRIFIAEVESGPEGFVACGPARGGKPIDNRGEIYALYQEMSSAGTGVGTELLLHAMQDLKAEGFAVAVLWVLQSNARARRFYERAGWHPDGGAKTEQRGVLLLDEVRYRKAL